MKDPGPSILQCPNCGASLSVEDEDVSTICPFCGKLVTVPEEYRLVKTSYSQDDQNIMPQATRPVTSNRVLLVIVLAVVILLCLTIFLFISAANEGGLFSSNWINQEYLIYMSNQFDQLETLFLNSHTPLVSTLFQNKGCTSGRFCDIQLSKPSFITPIESGNYENTC